MASRESRPRRPTIGILSFMLGEEYFGSLLVGIQRTVIPLGGHVIGIQTLSQWHDIDALMEPDVDVPYARDLVDGYVVIVDAVGADDIRRIKDTGKPIVSISRSYPGLSIPAVFPDNHRGVVELVQHLVEHGHRRIGFAGWLPNDDVRERYEAYQFALREAGIEPDPSLLFVAPDMVENGGVVVAEAMIAAGMPCTAVCVATDQTAVALMARVQEAGYRVPGDLAVTGFDDSALAAYSTPPLTTVRQDNHEIGAVAARILLERLAGVDTSFQVVYVPSTPMYRQSCGCRASGAPVVRATHVPVADWALELRTTMPRVARGVDGHQIQALVNGINHLIGALETMLDGGALPPPETLAQACRDLYLNAASLESANRAFGLLQAAGYGRLALVGDNVPLRTRLNELLDEMRLEQVYAARAEFVDRAREFEAIGEKNYRVSLQLLEPGQGSVRDLTWLAGTSVSVGCLGLWRGGAVGVELTVAGIYRRDRVPAFVAKEAYRVESFPPMDLFETAMQGDESQAIMVIPLQSERHDLGVLALLSPIDARTTSSTPSAWQWSVLLIDALERELLVRSLRESEERYALAARGTKDGLWDWNLLDQSVYYSPRWKEMLGYADDEIDPTPASWLNRAHAKDRGALKAAIARQIADRTEHLEHEYRMRHKNGTYRWMLCRGVVVLDDHGNAVRIAGSQTDITAQKQIEERLAHMAHHDALTGLPNRTLFYDRMAQCIVASRRHHLECSVMMLDLNDFKAINDTHGHAAGDRLLQGLASRIHDALRESDTVARMGGDEFAVVLNGTGESGALIIADRIRGALNEPIILDDGGEITSGASIGLAVYPIHGDTVDALLEHADQQMYAAKRGRGSR